MPSFIFTQLAADLFDRPNENPLNPAVWTTSSAWTGGDFNMTALQIVSDQCVPAGTHYSTELYTEIYWPTDQWAECVLASSEAPPSILLRSNIVDNSVNCYNFEIRNVGSAGNGIILAVGEVSHTGQLASLDLEGLTLNQSDIIRVAVIGLTLYAWQNGNLLGSAVDTIYNYTSGSAGLVLDGVDAGAVTNFAGGLVTLAYSISGNAGIAGATVSYSGPASGSVTADGSGNYTIPVLLAGTYTVTPSTSKYAFSPVLRTVNLTADTTGINFTAVIPDDVFGFSTNWLFGQQDAGLGVYISPGKINEQITQGAKFPVPPNTTTYFWVTSGGQIQSGPSMPAGVHPLSAVVSGNVATGNRSQFFSKAVDTSPGVLGITDLRPTGPFSFS